MTNFLDRLTRWLGSHQLCIGKVVYIHFAFSELARMGDSDGQLSMVIENIFNKRLLRASECPEFLPAWPEKQNHGLEIDIDETAKLNKDKLGDGDHLEIVPATRNDLSVIYLPEMVQMLCFISIPLKKLKSSNHTQHYGRFGLAFSKSFYKRVNARFVGYYTEEDLRRDPLIIEFNKNQLDGEEKNELIRNITLFRKPAILTENFHKSIVYTINKYEVTGATYDRYPVGYDFRNEHEVRVYAGQECAYVRRIDEHNYISFTEEELLFVLVPNEGIKARLNAYFRDAWTIRPTIILCP